MSIGHGTSVDTFSRGATKMASPIAFTICHSQKECFFLRRSCLSCTLCNSFLDWKPVLFESFCGDCSCRYLCLWCHKLCSYGCLPSASCTHHTCYYVSHFIFILPSNSALLLNPCYSSTDPCTLCAPNYLAQSGEIFIIKIRYVDRVPLCKLNY